MDDYTLLEHTAAGYNDRKQQTEYAVSLLNEVSATRAFLAGLTISLVHDARVDGSTWDEIADALGVTKQAAQQRFGAKP